MLILHPHRVLLGSSVLDNVSLIAIDRSASRMIIDRGDGGPLPTFADAAEETLSLRVVQHLTEHDLAPPRPGQLAALSWTTSTAAADGQARTFTVHVVVRSVRYDIPGARGARPPAYSTSVARTISLVALSPDGNSDPVSWVDDAPIP